MLSVPGMTGTIYYSFVVLPECLRASARPITFPAPAPPIERPGEPLIPSTTPPVTFDKGKVAPVGPRSMQCSVGSPSYQLGDLWP